MHVFKHNLILINMVCLHKINISMRNGDGDGEGDYWTPGLVPLFPTLYTYRKLFISNLFSMILDMNINILFSQLLRF